MGHVTGPSLKQCVVYSAVQSEAVMYLVLNSMTHLSLLSILDGCCVYALLTVVSTYSILSSPVPPCILFGTVMQSL